MNDPIYAQITERRRPSLTAASAFVLLATAGLWVSAALAGLLAREGANLWLLENALYYLPFLALPLLLYARRHPGLGEAMRLNPLPGLSVVTLALLGLVSVFLASAVAAAWGGLLDAMGLQSVGGLDAPQSERELALAILTMAALPAVCEELLFRGFVLSAWESRGTAFAIGVTAALFALIHGNLYGLPVYLMVGGIAGFVTYATDSVYAGMVYHTVYNAACLILPYLVRGQAEAAETATGSMAFALALDFILMASLAALMLVSLWLRSRNRLGIRPIPRVRRPLSAGEWLWLAAALLAMLASLAVLTALSTQV